MAHKAGNDFFAHKRHWSNQKDKILAQYIVSYLPKIRLGLKEPVCLVDGFAGPGTFEDGNPGSPKILLDLVRRSESGPGGPPRTKLFLIEKNPELFAKLQKVFVACDENVQLFNFEFRDVVGTIASISATHAVFLYLDPFTLDGLEWSALETLFQKVQWKRSVEVLMNFNAAIFVRHALAVRAAADAAEQEQIEDEMTIASLPAAAKLNQVAGGTWWESVIAQESEFEAQCEALCAEYCNRLRRFFKEVIRFPVRASPSDHIPKYFLIFGSRSPVALQLMNTVMAKIRAETVTAHGRDEPTLFETLPESVAPDLSKLPMHILAEAFPRVTRKQLVMSVVRAHPALFTDQQIRAAIARLVEEGRLLVVEGSRLNDDSVLAPRAPTRGSSA